MLAVDSVPQVRAPRDRDRSFLAFHDSTFECVARSYESVLASGPLDRLAGQMLALIRGGLR